MSSLNVECFRAQDLYGPASLGKVGNKVMLRSGGPRMTVTVVYGNWVRCRWGDNGEYSQIFSLDCLTCYGAE